MMAPSQFEEIAHAGGTVEFKTGPQGGVSVKYSHCSPTPSAIFGVCVSMDGRLLQTVPLGFDVPYPQPSILSIVISDCHGMYGRKCPSCGCYFRTTCATDRLACPYCPYVGGNVTFTTETQAQFITNFCNAFIEASRRQEDIKIPLDPLVDELENNSHGWVYSEEKQQNLYRCPDCQIAYDILGEYGRCTHCGKTNAAAIIHEKLNALENRVSDGEGPAAQVDWHELSQSVSEFESMANYFRPFLQSLPLTPKRRKEIERLSFQRVDVANNSLSTWFGIEMLAGLSEDERKFLRRMVGRRHVFTHNAGRVDQQYLDTTGDESVRMNQTLEVQAEEIARLVPLIRRMADNLIDGIESIKPIIDLQR